MVEIFHWLSMLLVSIQKKGKLHLKDTKLEFSKWFVRSKIISAFSNILNHSDETAWTFEDWNKRRLWYLSTTLKILPSTLATTVSSLRSNTLIKDPLLWRASASRASLLAHSCLYIRESMSVLAFKLLKICHNKISQNLSWSAYKYIKTWMHT